VPGQENPSAVRRALNALGLVSLVAAAAVGGNLFGLRDELFGSATGAPRPAATGFVAVPSQAPPRETVLRSQPWWQLVSRLRGAAGRSEALPISRDAIQWRVRWRCTSGRLRVRVPSQPAPLVDAACPGEGTAESSRPGRTTATVEARAAWSLRVEQQVDVPLDEPPLPAMSAPGTRVTASGRFYRIDQAATGRATLYRLAGGGYALRLAPFFVTPNVDLELRLSTAAAPRTTKQYLASKSVFVAPLPVTTGTLNFRLPAGVDPARFRSLVIWCPPTRNAYGAATLREA
jgi:hypothetical protein